VFEKQDGVPDLAGDPFGLQLLLGAMRFGVVHGSEAAEEHGAPSGS
jgi:hypothetical protein